MSKKSSLLLILIALVALSFGVSAGGGLLWNKLMEMHGVAPADPKVLATSWPPTGAGRLARAWVEAFNGGEEAMRTFLRANMDERSLKERSIESRLETYRELRKRYGTLALVGIRRSEDTLINAQISCADRKERTFSFELASGSPPKLRSVKITERQGH